MTEGNATVSQAGYQEITCPPAPVTKGKTYYIATQAASDTLYKFDSGATTGGFEARNACAGGFPGTLPGGWIIALLTGGMYIHPIEQKQQTRYGKNVIVIQGGSLYRYQSKNVYNDERLAMTILA